jgi:hypothetical protein
MSSSSATTVLESVPSPAAQRSTIRDRNASA